MNKILSIFIYSLVIIFLGNKGHAFSEPGCGLRLDEKRIPDDVMKIVEDDLILISKLSGSKASEFHRKIFDSDKIDGQKYCQFLRERIFSVSYTTSSESVIAENDYSGNLQLFGWYTKMPQAFRLGVWFHEAIHTSEPRDSRFPFNYLHHTCPNPYLDENGQEVVSSISGNPLANLSGCDSYIFSPNGIGYIWLANIGRYCENCSLEFKTNALEAAKYQFNYIDSAEKRKQLAADFLPQNPSAQ